METTRLLVEICRHGAKASKNIYPLTINDPADNFQVPFNLSQAGADQHYFLGADFVKQKYVVEKQFLSPIYDPSEVYVQCTEKDRSIASATA